MNKKQNLSGGFSNIISIFPKEWISPFNPVNFSLLFGSKRVFPSWIMFCNLIIDVLAPVSIKNLNEPVFDWFDANVNFLSFILVSDMKWSVVGSGSKSRPSTRTD